jgi:hypothetical protein
VNTVLISYVHKREESHGLPFFLDFVRRLISYLGTVGPECKKKKKNGLVSVFNTCL